MERTEVVENPVQEEASMFTTAFWRDLLERSVKTFCQTVVSMLGLGAIDIVHTDWPQILSVGAGAALISMLTSVASLRLGESGTASLTRSVQPKHAAD